MRRHAFLAALLSAAIGALVWLAGCSRCGDDVPEAQEVAGSQVLPWEQVELGVGHDRFRQSLAELAAIPPDQVAGRIRCLDQFTMDVVDPEARAIIERSGRGRELSNCALLQAGAGRSSHLVSARGEFVDGELERVTFAFAPQRFDDLVGELESRFGAGAVVTLEERSAVLLDSENMEGRLWKRGGELVALVRGDREVRLIRQDASLGQKLPKMPAAAERGKPVNLDDIGLGGGLDLDAALPEVDGLIGGDS